MPSRSTAFLGDLGDEVSSQISFMRSSYDLLTVVSESRSITYGGDVCLSDVVNSCSKGSVDVHAAVLSIGDTVMGIFLMVPRLGVSL